MVNIAESISGHVTREELLDVQSGLRKIVVEKMGAHRVDKAALFGALEVMRNSGELSQVVSDAEAKYQASPAHRGYLERVNDDGSRDIGMFSGGCTSGCE